MQAGRHRWRECASPEALAATLAHEVAERLERAIAERGGAAMAVSGGTTPKRFFACLSREPLAWDRVTVTLIDERFVPPASPRSNERLVRETLLRNEAADARFIGLYRDADGVEAAASLAAAEIPSPPFDVVVLGMGLDGHTASFFPDAGNLEFLLDPATPAGVYPVHAQSASEARLTLPLSSLADARFPVLHVEGAEKRRVLDRALAEPADSLPIRTLLDAASQPVQIVWAP